MSDINILKCYPLLVVVTVIILVLPLSIPIAFFFVAALALVFLKKNEITTSFSLFTGLLFSIVISIVSFDMDSVGDFKNYQELISATINNGVDYSIRGGEFGYYLIVSFLYSFTFMDSVTVHWCMLLITNILLFIGLIRLNSRLSLFLFIIIQFYWVWIVNPYLSRQTLSTTLIILAITVSSRIRILLLIFSMLIHFSALIAIFTVFPLNKYLKNKYFFIFCVFLAMSFLFIFEAESLRSINSSIPFINEKLAFYRHITAHSKVDYFAIISCCIIFITKYISVVRIQNNISSDCSFLIDVLFVSALLLIATINIPVLNTRLGFIANYFTPLVLVVLYKLPRLYLYTSLCVLYFSLMAVYKIYLNDYSIPWVLISDGKVLTRSIIEHVTNF